MKESKTKRQHNEYYLFGDRPVKLVSVDDNAGRQILKYDWDSGFFIPGSDYLQKILFAKDEVEAIAEAEFIAATETLRRTHFEGDNPVFALYQLVEAVLENAQSENRALRADEEALIAGINEKTYPLFEEVSVMPENYWKKQGSNDSVGE